MPKLRVNSKTMKKRACQLRDEARRMGALMDGLRDLSSSLQIEWQGAESNEFRDWYSDAFYPHLIRGQAVVNEFASAIESIVEEEMT